MPLFRPGAHLGSYELLRLIGSGAMGAVYEARHETLEKRVAVKVLHALAPGSSRAAISKARFLREGRAAAQVRHAHVVDVFDSGVEDGTPFLVMELVEGETLADKIAREGALPLANALALVLPVISAVADLNAAGIIHRDLKPANILLGRGRSGEMCPKVADFGVSRADDDSVELTEPGVVVGSYPYMPPEQVRDSRMATELSDQYAIGAILYECVTGKPLFDAVSKYDLSHAIMTAPFVPPTQRNPKLPRGLDAVLARALSRDPFDRFDCAEDLGAALLPFAERALRAHWTDEFIPSSSASAPMTIPPVESPRGSAPSVGPRGGAIGTFAMMCAVAGVGLFVVLGLQRERRTEVSNASPVAAAPLSAVADERRAPVAPPPVVATAAPAASPALLAPPPLLSPPPPAQRPRVAPPAPGEGRASP